MKRLGHVMILASAGSGKTYALTNRFVKLLALGTRPERIVALTFTRKAAGEFFDEILNKLALGASDREVAHRIAMEIEEPHLTSGDFLSYLRQMVNGIHRLNLGTLDGFFARIVRNFPLELGLTGNFEVLQEQAARLERQRVLRTLFQTSGILDAGQKDFMEAFKRATFGLEEKRLGSHLDNFLDQHHERFLAGPEADLWGNPLKIWPEGCSWLLPIEDVKKDREFLRAYFLQLPLTEKQQARCTAFLAGLERWFPGAPLPRPVEYFIENSLKVWGDLCIGAADITIERKKVEFAGAAAAAVRNLVTHVIAGEIRKRLEITRGIFDVLQGYETVYHETVRRAGKLTFADVQRLLMPGQGGPLLSQDGGERRMTIDFRLDATFDHWLLDEFQDTSYGQWSILRNLIDEAVQDPQRSLFYVGDVKQAIFTWREGDPELFQQIFRHYNSGQPGTIAEQHLTKSYRSGPSVIGMINAVFGAGQIIRTQFPEKTADLWNAGWRKHDTAKEKLVGQSALLFADGEQGRFQTVVDLLKEIQPARRGLSTAVLVKKNSVANELAGFLRERGVAAIADSDLKVCKDNPLAGAILALVKLAGHPGDTLAWEHVRMTPVGGVLDSEGFNTPDTLVNLVLSQIHTRGFEGASHYWLAKLEAAIPENDAFNHERARQFVAAAQTFDRLGNRDIDEFIGFMESYTLRDADATSAVRIMTIHKSKGLGFDVVLIPDLEGPKLTTLRDQMAVQKTSDRSLDWMLDLPPQLIREADPQLSAYVAAAEAEQCYEKLSLLYVAMTRAKRAMYLIIEPPGDSSSKNYTRFLVDTLGAEARPIAVGQTRLVGSYETGQGNWMEGIALEERVPPKSTEAVAPLATTIGGERLQSHRPSHLRAGKVSSEILFSGRRSASSDFGTAVHALFSRVEWWNPAMRSKWIQQARSDGFDPAVITEVVGCLDAPDLRFVFREPANPEDIEVWRERSFEIIMDGGWITGTFDRVHAVRNRDAEVASAVVYDFKTENVGGGDVTGESAERLRAKHGEQLKFYRRALAKILGIEESRVESNLVFTTEPRLVLI